MKARIESSREQMGGCHYTFLTGGELLQASRTPVSSTTPETPPPFPSPGRARGRRELSGAIYIKRARTEDELGNRIVLLLLGGEPPAFSNSLASEKCARSA